MAIPRSRAALPIRRMEVPPGKSLPHTTHKDLPHTRFPQNLPQPPRIFTILPHLGPEKGARVIYSTHVVLLVPSERLS